MSEQEPSVYAPDGSTSGTTRQDALRPAATFRWAMLVPLTYLVITFTVSLYALMTGQADSTATQVITNAVIMLPLAYVSLRLWTTRVWVEHSFETGSTMYDQWTLNKTQFGRYTKGILRSSNTVHIHAPAPTGARPSWRLTVTDPDGHRTFTCSAPWVTDFNRLLFLLRQIAVGDPGLVTDTETRDLLTPGTTSDLILFDSDFYVAREYPGQPMDLSTDDLRDLLVRSHVPESAYALNTGTTFDEAFVLDRVGDQWATYYSEHGHRTNEKRFTTEHGACAALLWQLRRIYPITADPDTRTR